MGQAVRFSASVEPEEMAASMVRFAPLTDAEGLKLLRDCFPDQSLSARVAALDYLMRRKSLPVTLQLH